MMRIFFQRLAKAFTETYSESVHWPASTYGVPMVTQSVRHVVTLTPANADITSYPCDMLHLSADANVSLVAADGDTASPVTMALKAGWNQIACRRVVSASAGTVTAAWLRGPAT